jgi:hypothetical protein
MTLAADKVLQNKLMSTVYVFLHHLEHTPTSNIGQLHPRRNQKYVINRNPSCVVKAAERCAMFITKQTISIEFITLDKAITPQSAWKRTAYLQIALFEQVGLRNYKPVHRCITFFSS